MKTRTLTPDTVVATFPTFEVVHSESRGYFARNSRWASRARPTQEQAEADGRQLGPGWSQEQLAEIGSFYSSGRYQGD